MTTGHRNYIRADKHFGAGDHRRSLGGRKGPTLGLKRDMRNPNLREYLRSSMIARLAAAVRAKEVAELMDKMEMGKSKPKRTTRKPKE